MLNAAWHAVTTLLGKKYIKIYLVFLVEKLKDEFVPGGLPGRFRSGLRCCSADAGVGLPVQTGETAAGTRPSACMYHSIPKSRTPERTGEGCLVIDNNFMSTSELIS